MNLPNSLLIAMAGPLKRAFRKPVFVTLQGEELFTVEWRDDDSVWIEIRSFSRPSSRWWWAVYPALRLAQAYFLDRYLRALGGPMSAEAHR